MDKIQSGIKTALKEQTLCDFVANHYWEMSKEQLKDVIVELICSAHTFLGRNCIEGFYEDVSGELEDRGFFDD